MRQSAALRIDSNDAPDWQGRSALVLKPGLWAMRNGHTAKIKKRVDIPYKCGATGQAKVYSIWAGICVQCDCPMTWTLNGCFAPNWRHRNDIVGPA